MVKWCVTWIDIYEQETSKMEEEFSNTKESGKLIDQDSNKRNILNNNLGISL